MSIYKNGGFLGVTRGYGDSGIFNLKAAFSVFRVLPIEASGGTITEIEDNGILYRVHTFTSDGTFEVTRGGEVDYLVVAGGGGGGQGSGGNNSSGGAGGGGVILGEQLEVSAQSFTVNVGQGGSAFGRTNPGGSPPANGNGVDSSVFGAVALGGGAAGPTDDTPRSGGFGNAGGNRNGTNSNSAGGGGGGAGAPGQNAPGLRTAGNGGVGFDASALFGDSVGEGGFFGGGGGGGRNESGSFGQGGQGGGGNGGLGNAQAGMSGTGGGGGGGGTGSGSGGAGGSGIVIIRYRIG